jgi:hypothetical protein
MLTLVAAAAALSDAAAQNLANPADRAPNPEAARDYIDAESSVVRVDDTILGLRFRRVAGVPADSGVIAVREQRAGRQGFRFLVSDRDVDRLVQASNPTAPPSGSSSTRPRPSAAAVLERLRAAPKQLRTPSQMRTLMSDYNDLVANENALANRVAFDSAVSAWVRSLVEKK